MKYVEPEIRIVAFNISILTDGLISGNETDEDKGDGFDFPEI